MLNTSATLAQETFYSLANEFFMQHIVNGRVDYRSIHDEPAHLNDLVNKIGDMSLSGKSDNFIKAFYINAYNILAIKQVVERYPIKGPMQVSGFFNQIKHQVAGEKITLDQLEKATLFAKYPDSRMHFALVCAAKGCPPLADFAFHPDKLDQQLNQITSKAFSNGQFLKVEEDQQRVHLSQIFEWYRQDFLKKSNNLIDYINNYRSEKIPTNFKIRYYKYDWSLNDV